MSVPTNQNENSHSCMKRRIGLILVILNLINVVIAMFYFLISLKLSFTDWLAVNGCTPSILLFTAGFFFRKPILTGLSVPFLFFFGTGGLLTFPWDMANAVPQISHSIMTISLIWIIYDAVVIKGLRKCLLGLVIGIILLVPTLKIIFAYQARHPYLYDILRIPEEYRHR